MDRSVHHIRFSQAVAVLVIACSLSCQERAVTRCEPKRPDISEKFTANEKNMIALGGFETLIYVSNTGDTIKLKGNGRQTGMSRLDDPAQDGCPIPQTRYYEYVYCRYTADSGALSGIELNVGKAPNTTYLSINLDRMETNPENLHNPAAHDDSVLVKGTYYRTSRLVGRNSTVAYYNYQHGPLKIELVGGQTYLRQL